MASRVLVVFVDALGPRQLAQGAGALPSLPHHRSLSGVLGFSSGALATVLTGVMPADHGRMCLFAARPADQPSILLPLRWLGLLPSIVHERSRVRDLAGRLFAKAAGLTGYVALHRVPPSAFEWLDLPEREDIFAAENIGGARTFLADARAAGLGVYAARWQAPEEQRWEDSQASLERHQPDLAFLYATELDGKLHEHGNREDVTSDVLARVGGRIERARDAMARGGASLTTLVVGDHGMADIHTTLDPRPITSQLATRFFVDSTMLRVWGDDAQLAAARLRIESSGWPGRWLARAALEKRFVPMTASAYGDAVFLLDEGLLFAPSYVGGAVKGMHGYDIGSTSASAALASDSPIPPACGSIADVAGLVRARLGLG